MLDYLSSVHFAKWQKKSKWRYIKMAIIANLLHIILIVLGYKRLMKVLERFQREPIHQYAIAEVPDIKRLKKAVNPIFKKIRKSKIQWANCFSSSILLWHVLKQQGLTTNIVIGTRKKKGQFKAHAWVEYATIPLNEHPRIREKYAVFEHDFSSIKANLK